MKNEQKTSSSIADNLYAFLGWVVSYSDYGKEMSVDSILKKFNLLDRIEEGMCFANKKEYDEYEELIEKFAKEELYKYEEYKLSEYEQKRCDELKSEFTLRFKRAKEFTKEQIVEYVVRKRMGKEPTFKRCKDIVPVKLIDHETKEVVCMFYSIDVAARILNANRKKIKDAADDVNFYKGYIWSYTTEEMYYRYNEKISRK